MNDFKSPISPVFIRAFPADARTMYHLITGPRMNSHHECFYHTSGQKASKPLTKSGMENNHHFCLYKWETNDFFAEAAISKKKILRLLENMSPIINGSFV